MTGDRSNQHRRVFHAISDQDRAYSAARVDRDRKLPCSISARSRPPPPGRRSQRPVRSVGKSKSWTGSRRFIPARCFPLPGTLPGRDTRPSSEASLALVRIVPMSPWLRFVSFVSNSTGLEVTTEGIRQSVDVSRAVTPSGHHRGCGLRVGKAAGGGQYGGSMKCSCVSSMFRRPQVLPWCVQLCPHDLCRAITEGLVDKKALATSSARLHCGRFASWKKHGAETLEQMRREDPAAYVRVVASILPDKLDVGVTHRFDRIERVKS
jgi:hypothetical protein